MPTRLEPIVKTALLGTERRPLQPAELAAIGLEPTGTDPAQTALEALVAMQLRSKAGFVLADAPPDVPLSAPVDKRPVCQPVVLRLLQQMLAGQHLPALPEFVDLLIQSGQRLPPEMLPDILHKGLDNKTMFSQLEPLLGPVGHWLAQQHFRWRTLLSDPLADWFTAGFEARLRLLRAKRRQSPLVALAWLEATWAQESSAHQLHFLEALVHGLSAFDEPLLQRAAADKKDTVRLAALRLLDLLRLSPAERLQLATAKHADLFPAGVPTDHWPKTARLALLTAAPFPPAMLNDVWLLLLGQLAGMDRSTPGFFDLEEMLRLLAYQGGLTGKETGLHHFAVQLPKETGQLLANVLLFRRQMHHALIREHPAA